MNFVELVEALRTEGGLSGAPVSSLGGATGETLRLKNWISRSWLEIQGRHPDWLFLRGRFAFRTAAKDYRYTAEDDALLSDFKAWKLDSLNGYVESLGSQNAQQILPITWEDWYYLYGRKRQSVANPSLVPVEPDGTTVISTDPNLSLQLGTFASWSENIDTTGLPGGRPVWVSQAPDRALVFAPVPDDAYIITGEYLKKPQTLAADTDAPIIPNELHMVIVYDALKKLARFESDASLLAEAKSGYDTVYTQLCNDWLPPMSMATLETR